MKWMDFKNQLVGLFSRGLLTTDSNFSNEVFRALRDLLDETEHFGTTI